MDIEFWFVCKSVKAEVPIMVEHALDRHLRGDRAVFRGTIWEELVIIRDKVLERKAKLS